MLKVNNFRIGSEKKLKTELIEQVSNLVVMALIPIINAREDMVIEVCPCRKFVGIYTKCLP